MNWQVLSILIVVIVIYFLLTGRRRRSESPRLTSAINAITNVNDDMRLLELHMADRLSTKKFKNGGLANAEEKLMFLDAPTLAALKETYTLTSEFNQRIDNAKKARAPSTLQDLPLDKLTEPLNKSKAGLVVWLKGNLQNESQNTRRSFLGF
jgi:hypothetical protein